MAELELRKLTKSFGNTDAVKALDLSVTDGEFLVLVGPSGCGKTTTLRMIAGLEQATAGDILLDGRRINDVPPKDRDMAMVFQDYALYPHMSVRDNMAFGLKMRGVPKTERYRQVDSAAEMLGLTPLLCRKPAALSGGERQRVALGRAIVRRPRISLFDEPLSNLDAALRVQMRADLKRLHKELNTTFIYVTHDQIEAMTMATRIAVLDHGVLQQLGTPDEIYHRPQNTFVAGFVGTPRMNLLPCYFNMQDAEMLCYLGDARIVLPEAQKERVLAARLMGRQATLGVRSENVHPTDGVGVAATVAYTENIGAQQYVYLDIAGLDARAVMTLDASAAVAESVRVAFDWDAVKLFDAETGDICIRRETV